MNAAFHPDDLGGAPVPAPLPRESADVIVRTEPRISATKLAEYVIADPSRQKTIIREAKYAKKILMVPYSKVRKFIPHAFSADSLDIDRLGRRAEEIEREEWNSEWQKRDNADSALALKKIIEIAPELSWRNARLLHMRLAHLEIRGVRVSVQPEIIFAFEHRNITKVGGIILNTAKGADKSLSRSSGTYCVGDYLSSLLFQALLAQITRIGAPLNSKCYAVDVFRGQTHTAPGNYKTLTKHMENACEVIALRWPEIEQRG